MHLLALEATEAASEIGFMEGEAKARAVEVNYQRRKGNYSGAIDEALKVVKIYDSLALWKSKVSLLNIISDVYKEMGGEKGTMEFLYKGLELSRQAQQLAEDKRDTDGVVISFNQQGIIYRDLSKRTHREDLLDSALQLYLSGLQLVGESGEGINSLGKLYNNTSQIYIERKKDYRGALNYLFKAVAFNGKHDNKTSLSFNYGNISEAYLKLGKKDSARYYASAMLALADELGLPHRKVNAYRALIRVMKSYGRYDSALLYKELETSVADSLNNIEKTAQIAESQTKFETGKKEVRITELSAMNRAKQQRMWWMAAGVLILSTLTGLFILQNHRLQRQKKQIAEQSDRLQWMMKELHHRVKNNLQIVSSLLNLQSYRLKDEESVSAIRESQLRVQAMSLMHQRLYQVDDVSMVNFRLYLDDLVDTLMRAYGYNSDDFDLSITVQEELLDVDTVMPMGLLVNEIITNSFKYAYPAVERPALQIRLEKQGKKLQLDISDNGPGIPEKSATDGFGRKLIRALSQQMKATYSVNADHGTSYSFTIPYEREKAA